MAHPIPAIPVQSALSFGPGRFRTLLTFRLTEEHDDARRAALVRCATLLAELEHASLRDKPLKILVAVSYDLLRVHESASALAVEAQDWDEQHSPVLVQIAAETEDERTYARRLVKRVFGPHLTLVQELNGGRHTVSREAFGYQDGGLDQKPVIPQSAAAPGATWLLYQRCVQLVDKMAALKEAERDAVVGQKANPNPTIQSQPPAGSHLDVARKINGTKERAKLVRRSIGYETFAEEGLAFLATAAHPQHLSASLEGLQGDRLLPYIELKEKGLYLVPPNAAWLSQEARPVAGGKRPPQEEAFFPQLPIVLYEVTPKTLEFFHRVFHRNKDNFEDGGALRKDLKLVAGGLIKLLYGGSLPSDSALYGLLDAAFVTDTSAPIAKAPFADPSPVQTPGEAHSGAKVQPLRGDALRDAISDLRRKRLAHEVSRRVEGVTRDQLDAEERTFRASVANERLKVHTGIVDEIASRPQPSWANKTAFEIYCDVVAEDSETTSGLTAATRIDIQEVLTLCEDAAKEARAVNETVGRYMTFVM